ncbi:MAG: hypothetical protein Q4D81_00455 [Eubacteriales bacterium]|nr:hypothetical protein [Eubacteriales bacterium]
MSTNENSAQEIQKRFNKRVSADPYLKKLMERVENGSATFADVDTYACQVAECYNTAIHEVLGDVGIEEYRQAAQTTIPKGFHALYDRASDYTEQFINAQLQDAGIGMKAVRAEYDAEKERDVTGKILERTQAAEEISQVEGFSNLQVESFAQKAATNTLQKNAEVQSRAGLEVTVTRIYDGVGLHDGKDECKWCLERRGENMPYSEAYAKGAFSRHPGCHCEILYKTAKGIQRQTDWTHNQWEDVADEQALKIRRRFAEEDSSLSARERISVLEVAQSPGDAVKPRSMFGDYYDYNEIDIDDEAINALRGLKAAADKTGWEYGRSRCDGVWLEPHTDNKHNDVAIPYLSDAKNVELYHCHTDESPPSAEDMRAFATPSIQRIGVLSCNGDGWIIDIGSGIRPTKNELDEALDLCYNQAKDNLQGDPTFWEWTYEERSYMLVRERMRLVANYFEWDVMGGVLYE